MLFRKRRGSLEDMAFLMAAVFVLILVTFLGKVVWNNVMPAFNSTIYNTSDAALYANWTQANTNIVGGQDLLIASIPFVTVGVGIAAIVAAAMIPASSVFFPFALFCLGIFAIIAALFSNSLSQILSAPTFVAIANANPIVVSVAQYLPHIIVGLGILVIIVMYARAGGGSSY